MDGGKAQAGAHSASLRKANNKATLPCRRLWNTFGVQRNPTRACSYDFLVLKMFNKRSRDKFTIRIPFNILKDIWSAPHPYREVLLYVAGYFRAHILLFHLTHNMWLLRNSPFFHKDSFSVIDKVLLYHFYELNR